MNVKDVFLNKMEAEIERRFFTNFLDLIILRILSSYKRSMGGYDIIRHLQLNHNILLSSGTVYSCLYTLERRDLIKGRQNGRKRVYTLTELGNRTVEAIECAKGRFNRLVSMILYGIKC